MLASAAVVMFSLALVVQAQPIEPRKDRTTTGGPGGAAEEGTKSDAHGAKATGGQERGTTGPSTSGWDPAGARAGEQHARTGAPPTSTAPNPTATGVKHRHPRGSWEDNPRLNTQMGQQSATYEDVTGARPKHPTDVNTTKAEKDTGPSSHGQEIKQNGR